MGIPAAPLRAQALAPAPLAGGAVTFLVHSTFVGGIAGHAPFAEARFSGDDLRLVRGFAVVRVADMQTGNGARDRHLRETLRADSFPTIRFDLDSLEVGASTGDRVAVFFRGRLTIHGVTRSVRAPGSVALAAGRVDVDARFPIDMRDYAVRPPVRALVLRVAPDVVVSAHLAFAGPAPN